jgi:iron complex outermembrane receptor protein
MSHYYKFALLATTALCFGLAEPAFAAKADNGDEEIIVTARRKEERLQDVPISITVFNQKQLDDRNIVSAKDLVIYTPSLSANPRYGSEGTSFSIRGFVQDQFTAPSVAIYFADVVAPRGNTAFPVGDGAGPGSFFDLENTQVLKGPQGTLFGRNTTGGAILLVPKKPTAEFGGSAEISAGNYGMERIRAVINTPLGSKARLRMGVDQMMRDGYQKNISGIGPRDFNDIGYIAGRASLVVDITPELENYTIVSISNSDTNGSIGRGSRCAPNIVSSGGGGIVVPVGAMNCAQVARLGASGDFFNVENSVPNPYSRAEQWQVINTTTWHVTDQFTIKNIASYAQLKNFLSQDVYGTFWSILQGGGPALPASAIGQPATLSQVRNFPGLPLNHQSTITEELQFQGRGLNGRLTWQAGAYMELSDPLSDFVGTASYSTLLCTNPSTFQCSSPYAAFGSTGIELRHTSFRDMGYYAQGSYDLTQKLRFTGGIRFSDDRSAAEDRTFQYRYAQAGGISSITCTNAGAVLSKNCSSATIQHSKAPTWLIDLDYKPMQDVMIYAKYSRGYRQGLVNPRGLSPYKNFGSEKVDSYELGAKTSWQGRMPGMFDVAAFYNDFSNQQILVGLRQGTLTGNLIANTGTSRLWGVEAQLNVSPFEGFRLDANFTYLNTLLEKADIPAPPAPFTPADNINRTVPGWPFPFAPEFKESVTATYTLPVPDTLGTIAISSTFTYTDSYAVIEGPGVKVGSIALLNLNMNWNSIAGSPIDLSVFASNVTDNHYNSFLAEATSVGILSTVAGEPQMFGARVKYRFGSDAQ